MILSGELMNGKYFQHTFVQLVDHFFITFSFVHILYVFSLNPEFIVFYGIFPMI